MKVVVVGGTGLVGSRLVARLETAGHSTVPASPNTGVNTITGQGLAAALDGADVVVDVSNSPSFEEHAVLEFFETSTRHLLAAEEAAGVTHHVALSVVGTDRLTESPYFRAKLAQERIILASAIPHTIVRATQFFEFLRGIADAATDGDQVRLPAALIQPMAVDDVAEALAVVAAGPPEDGIVEIGGPQRFRLDEVITRVLSESGDPREVVTDPSARYFGARLDELTLVPGGDADLARIRLEDWLAAGSTPG